MLQSHVVKLDFTIVCEFYYSSSIACFPREIKEREFCAFRGFFSVFLLRFTIFVYFSQQFRGFSNKRACHDDTHEFTILSQSTNNKQTCQIFCNVYFSERTTEDGSINVHKFISIYALSFCCCCYILCLYVSQPTFYYFTAIISTYTVSWDFQRNQHFLLKSNTYLTMNQKSTITREKMGKEKIITWNYNQHVRLHY